MGFLFSKAPNQVLQKQITNGWAPHSMGVHYMAHRTNLVVQALSHLQIVNKIECLFQTLYNYFSKSPKKHFKFMKLMKLMETKGAKNLKMWKPTRHLCCPLHMLW
jgi:hypothetical protein